VIVKDAICFMENLAEIFASQTLHSSIEKPMLRPQPKLRCGGGERARLGSRGARKYGCDQTGCGGQSVVEQPTSLIGTLNPQHDKSANKRRSLETKPIPRGTESSNSAPSSGESIANLFEREDVG